MRHCCAVSEAAVKMGQALNRCGWCLDLDLIQAAGLIHDIARVEEEHWEKGYELARSLGYEQEAAIIRVHMRYSPFSPIDQINETDLVCLGDRLVLEDQYVGLDKRMDYIIEKAKKHGHPEAEQRILRKKEETRAFITSLEEKIGMTLDELMERD